MRMTTAGRTLAAAGFLVAALAGGAAADWRDDLRVLRVGVMTGANATYRMAQLAPFRAYLESRLAVPVEIVPVPTYAALIDAQARAHVHYAVYSATAFATAAARCNCVEPLALPARSGGETGFHALLVARADGAIHTLADAKGARLALAGADSIAGRLLPLMAFDEAGIAPFEYFDSVVDVADPEMAVTALLADEADLAVAWSSLAGDRSAGYSFGVLADLVADGGLSMDQIRIVWRSPLIPFGPHAVRADLAGDLKRLLREALLAMAFADPSALDAIDRSGGSGFVAADAGLYAPVEALLAPPSEP